MTEKSEQNLNFENLEGGSQEPLEVIKDLPQEAEVHVEKTPEEKIDATLERQDAQLGFRENSRDKNTMSGLKKWLGVAVLAGSSMLAIGCNAEKPSSGFTDNVQQNVQQRLNQKRQEIKHMKEMKNYKPGPEAQQAAKEMQESQIVQPYDGSGFSDQVNGVQGPGKNVEQGPTGRVMNPEDL
jgi:hypothetical protein